MKKKRLYKNRKKHAYGTPVTNYIENPGTELAENRIDLAQARHKAATNPWVQGTAIAGHAISQNADLIAGGLGILRNNGKGDMQVSDQYTSEAGITTAGTGGPVGATEVGMEFQNSADYKNIYAFGGQTSNVPVEVDGGEVAETPEGELMEFQGPDHEQGGVDVNLPPGTDIYSKRLRVGGKTLAQRKKDRERKLNRVTKQLEKNPSDSVLKNTFKRVQENNAKEEANDKAFQEKVNAEMEAQGREYAYGTGEDGVNPTNPPNPTTPYDLDENGNPLVGPGDVFRGGNPNEGYEMPKWMESVSADVYSPTLSIDYKGTGEEGKLRSGYYDPKIINSKGETPQWSAHKTPYRSNTKIKGDNNVVMTWKGTAEEHEDTSKKINRANWSGAHGFRGKNWKKQVENGWWYNPNLTDKENIKKYKEKNKFYEKGRVREQYWNLASNNQSMYSWYTNPEKRAEKKWLELEGKIDNYRNITQTKAYGGKVEKFGGGGTTPPTTPPYEVPKTKEAWEARVKQARTDDNISNEEYDFLTNMDQSIYKKGGSNYVEPQKNIDFKQVNHPLEGRSGTAPVTTPPTTSTTPWKQTSLSTNPSIKEKQEYLLNEGYSLGKTGKNKDGVDGIWGKKSKAAWEENLKTQENIKAQNAESQKINPITYAETPDGYVDPEAVGRLEKLHDSSPSYSVSDAYPEAPGNIMAGTSNDGVEFNPLSPEGFTEPIPNAVTETMPGGSLSESNAPVNPAKERFLKAMNYTPSASEALGIAGQIYSGVKPMQTTLANRATDSANVNEFKNFGQDALAAIEAQKGFVAQQEARKLQDIESQRLSALKRGRNSARSANTQRALDLASTQGANKASGMARSQSAKEMMAILNSQAQAETMQDRMVMQGEQNRDLADRQDKDNFYTQLSNNQVNLGSSMQAISRNLGKIASNNEKRNLINSRSTVFMLDKKGNITTKDGRKLGEEELKKAVQDLGLDKEEVEEDK